MLMSNIPFQKLKRQIHATMQKFGGDEEAKGLKRNWEEQGWKQQGWGEQGWREQGWGEQGREGRTKGRRGNGGRY